MSEVGQLEQQPDNDENLRCKQDLAASVVGWFLSNGREFPWRSTSNPFHILIAETLLRQTQAARVVGPYFQLISKYPDPASFAKANVNALREWFRPLGLVRRADNLVECSRRLVQDYEGQVPKDICDLQSLPGIGRYGARAILCLAFNHPVPMIDGGSGRVLRRVFGLPDTGPAFSDVRLAGAAERVLPDSKAREFNLALIDLGAAFCHPRKPHCSECPILRLCTFGSSRLERN